MIFIETLIFTSQLAKLDDDEAYQKLQREILQNPEKGAIIPQSGGLRKIRMALSGRGKSGSSRVIYLYLPLPDHTIFFYLYLKTKSENLSKDELKILKKAVETIKSEYRYEN